MRRRAGIVAASALVLVLIVGLGLIGVLRASRPRLDGEAAIAGLSAPVTVERDALGVPAVRATTRADAASALGFLHAQERFFQMDLLRRRSAGELAELFGPLALPVDRATRIHRFRSVARTQLARLPGRDRAVLDAYAAGVAAGLAALGARPPEYLLLRARPAPWMPEDTLLVVLTLYLDLQEDNAARESALGLLHDVLPAPLADLLAPRGTEWDAPLVGEAYATPPIPPADVFDLRGEPPAPRSAAARRGPTREIAGSNAFAVSGAHAAGGGAWLASDMHLALRLPNIWYRACLSWDGAGGVERVAGLTLPGTPVVIAGSNGHVAWGFTNAQGDTSDLVLLDQDPAAPDRYRTPHGVEAIVRSEETIAVHGADDERAEVSTTIWGPVRDRDHRGRLRVLRWIAHDAGAVDLGLMALEGARSVEEALAIGAGSGLPLQNLVVAGRDGRIGWTLAGAIPQRIGFPGRLPASWAEGTHRWEGILAAEAHPRLVDPPQGRIWSANQRAVDGPALAVVGDGGYDLGARAGQIRDDLLALPRADAASMLGIQLDDRALLLERWRTLLLATLGPADLTGHPERGELRRLVADGWSGRASIDSVGYRLVRGFRNVLARQVFEALTARCRAADPQFDFFDIGQWEGPLWRVVSEQPLHLLDPRHRDWHAQQLAAVDGTIAELVDAERPRLADRTWGERNTLRLRHPLSQAVPQLARWIDVPAEPLPGDRDMPRVQGTAFGATARMVVSPGHEELGSLHMPGGQSGHPLAATYSAGHAAWARGEPAPFLPGPPVDRLVLVPSR